MAPALVTPGQGLCAATAMSTNVSRDFSPDNAAAFPTTVNALMERDAASRTDATLQTVFDLSNNHLSVQRVSYGDFTDAQFPACKTGGCDYVYNDTTTSFGMRLRGYLNVTSDLVGHPLHFGFYADDAVAFTIYDKSSKPYVVVDRPPQLGRPTWRTTNTVRFTKSGLYPVEVLYAQVSDDAAMEMSLLDSASTGTFTDIEDAANNTTSLKASSFKLLTPDSFYQAENGGFSFPDPAKCVQCNRQNAGLPGNADCGSSLYCNSAALCSPCDSTLYCGPSCTPCALATPICLNVGGTYSCVQCNKNSDCGTQVCDTNSHTCKECNADKDCPQGKVCDTAAHECKQCNLDGQCGRGTTCQDHACLPCNTKDHCAGASCNCCPGGNLKCDSLSPGAQPTCVECVRDADCASGKRCDTVNGRCLDKVANCNTPDQCGASCARCPADRPYCLDGQVCVECSNDLQCGNGRFCISGECTSCVTDRHCGARCGACGGDTPFCLSDGTVGNSSCVRCLKDSDCANGTCDTAKHTCTSACAMTCADNTVCNGSQCVQCYTSAQCPCGGSCDNNTCVAACGDSADCAAGQHCSADKTCEQGRVKPDTEPRGGGLCCGIAGPPTAGGILVAVLTLAFLSRRRRAV